MEYLNTRIFSHYQTVLCISRRSIALVMLFSCSRELQMFWIFNLCLRCMNVSRVFCGVMYHSGFFQCDTSLVANKLLNHSDFYWISLLLLFATTNTTTIDTRVVTYIAKLALTPVPEGGNLAHSQFFLINKVIFAI